MAIAFLEIQRARKALDAYCARRNQTMRGPAGQLSCQWEGDDLLLVEQRTSATPGDETAVNPLVRLRYGKTGWLLFCPDLRGSWTPYPHLHHADSIETVVNELEQAPLHVHW